tara:strand:- start:72 stop:2057 length:1986 start_codon:yes stop_codon:yes gene_type:complete
MTTRGIFILENVRSRQREGEWVPVDNVWVNPGSGTPVQWKSGDAENPNKGFFYADTGSWYTLDMTTDTHNELGSDSGISGQGQGFSSLTHGYKAGGSNPGGTSVNDIEKIAYATNTGQNAGYMNRQRRGPMASGNMTHAWIGSGFSHGPGPAGRRSDFQKYTYSTESASASGSVNLPNDTSKGGGAGNQEYGYIRDGENSHTWTYKITYASDTGANTPGAYAANRYNGSRSWANPSSAFWTGGGNSVNQSVTKFPFATETLSIIPGVVAQNTSTSGGGAAGNHTHGYFQNGAGSRLHKLDYATETGTEFNTTPATWGWGNSVFGQSNGPIVTNPNTETPTPTKSPGPAFNGALWMGGYIPSNLVVSSGGKISFDDDTVTALPSTNLTANRYNLSATSSPDAGYYGQAQTTQVVKVTYATSSPSTMPGGLSGGSGGPAAPYDPRRRGTSFGLKTAGYFMQGSTGSSGPLNNLDKVTYSSDTSARLPGSNTPNSAYATVGTSNQTAGYQTGGTPGGSNMYKLPFATESWGSVPSLGVEMWDANSFANTTHGYFMGGSGNGTGSRTYKLTFSTDSSSRLPSSNVPQNIRYGWGSGNSSYGYMSGQQALSPSNPGTSIIYKLNYSNDSWSAVANNANPSTRQNAGAGARQSGNGDIAPNSTPNVV